MMTVSDIYTEYLEQTKAASESGRTLAFGAAAVGWFFRTDDFVLPKMVVIALLFVAIYFVLDILQVVISAVRLKRLGNKLEVEIREKNGDLQKEQVEKPKSFTFVPYLFFLLNFPCLLLAYLSLTVEFLLRIIAR